MLWSGSKAQKSLLKSLWQLGKLSPGSPGLRRPRGRAIPARPVRPPSTSVQIPCRTTCTWSRLICIPPLTVHLDKIHLTLTRTWIRVHSPTPLSLPPPPVTAPSHFGAATGVHDVRTLLQEVRNPPSIHDMLNCWSPHHWGRYSPRERAVDVVGLGRPYAHRVQRNPRAPCTSSPFRAGDFLNPSEFPRSILSFSQHSCDKTAPTPAHIRARAQARARARARGMRKHAAQHLRTVGQMACIDLFQA
jgi:hypothetical protein